MDDKRRIALDIGGVSQAKTTLANTLNESKDWENAYAAVTVSDAVLRVGKEIQATFGRDVRLIAPTATRFDSVNRHHTRKVRDSISISISARRSVNAMMMT